MKNRKDKQEYPKYLLHAFCEKDHAKDFLERGKFRVTLIQEYTKIVDEIRQDKDEGEGRLKVHGDISEIKIDKMGNLLSEIRQPGYYDYSHSTLNPIYIFSMSGTEVNLSHLVRYGKFIIQINNPHAFIKDVTDFFGVQAWVDIVESPYNKDQEVTVLPPVEERVLLSQAQKNKKDLEDKEWRLIITMESLKHNNEHYDINLNKKLDYCEWVPF